MTRRPCWVEIDTQALRANFKAVAELGTGPSRSIEMLAIVKADAYGHGLRVCAPAVLCAGARWLGVTSVEEGKEARQLAEEAGFPEANILVIAGVFPGQAAMVVEHRLTPVVWAEWQLEELEFAAAAAGPRHLSVHLELDTGMSRQGANAEQLDRLLRRFEKATPSGLRLDGVMTHLYAADELDGTVNRQQFDLLASMLDRIVSQGPKPRWLHVGNSAAVLNGQTLEALSQLCARFSLRPMARPGLALYGLAPAFEPGDPETVRKMREQLKPVLSWKTQVVSLRQIAAGQVVGYNGTFVASETMQLALLAVGYADGLRRELSNRGEVLVRGNRAPIVGRISMDQTVVDVTGIDGVTAGDEVALIGRQGEERISAEDHARWAGTIPWEIFTSISGRVERRAE